MRLIDPQQPKHGSEGEWRMKQHGIGRKKRRSNGVPSNICQLLHAEAPENNADHVYEAIDLLAGTLFSPESTPGMIADGLRSVVEHIVKDDIELDYDKIGRIVKRAKKRVKKACQNEAARIKATKALAQMLRRDQESDNDFPTTSQRSPWEAIVSSAVSQGGATVLPFPGRKRQAAAV